MSAYALSQASGQRGLVGLACLAGLGLLLASILIPWDDGIAAAPALLLLAYAFALADGGTSLDWNAPVVAASLFGLVEFGSWSHELRDGAEERPLARLPFVLLLTMASGGASAIVLTVGAVRTGAGLALWVLGAGAAMALIVVMTQRAGPPEAGTGGDLVRSERP